MTTAFDIQKIYYPQIDAIQKNPEEFAIKVLHLTQVLKEHLEGVPEHRDRVYGALRFNMLESFIKISPKLLGPMEVIRMLEDVFGEDGPMNGQPVSFSIVRENCPSWIAALHYLKSVGEESVAQIGKSNVTATIARIAFDGGRNWKALQKALDEVDAGCGTHFLDSVPDLLENAHNHFHGTSGGQMLQESGGVQRAKAVGADLNKLSQSVMQDLASTNLNEKGFPLMYAFLKEATLDLMAAGAISREEGSNRFSQMFEGTLHALTRQKNHKHDCWMPILKDLTKYANSSLNQVGLVNLGVYLTQKNMDLEGFNLKDLVEPAELKKAIKSAVYEGDRYAFIEKYDLKDHFTRPEMLLIKGARLKADLGM